MKKFTSKTQKIGEIGENLACRKFVRLGFEILCRNYTKQGGEIDIVAQKEGILHFIEVKSVSCEISTIYKGGNVTYETKNTYRPEENLSFQKFLKITRTIEVYFLENNVSNETPWQIDLACAHIDPQRKIGKVEILENIIL